MWVAVEDLAGELFQELACGVGGEGEVHAAESTRFEFVESLNDLVGLARKAEVPNDFWRDESRFVGFEVGVVALVELLMGSGLVSGR
jgi:hypothetical protein